MSQKKLSTLVCFGWGIVYSLGFGFISIITAVIGSLVTPFIFSKPCSEIGMGCIKTGLLDPASSFIVKQLVAVVIYFIPVVALSPFVAFAKLTGFFMRDPVVGFPSSMDSAFQYPPSFLLAFWLTIIYYVVVGIAVSCYQRDGEYRSVIVWIVKGLIIFHIAISLVITVLTVQLYPY